MTAEGDVSEGEVDGEIELVVEYVGSQRRG